ncbi:MAG: hypothetical protein AAGB00_12820 [Planctomycetota bacterium]
MTLLNPGDAFVQDPEAPGLQPVRLPLNAWADFSRALSDSLEELERRHGAVTGNAAGGRVSEDDIRL